MKVLVLGGNGFIGSHLVDKLLKEKHEVTVYDQDAEIFRAPFEKVKYIIGSFSNRQLIQESLSGIQFVFHLISTTLPKSSNDNPVFDVESNLINSIELLNDCVQQKIKRIIYISSGGTVYGNPLYIPINEDHYTNPICSYGITKLAIEKYLNLFKSLYGLDYKIIRPSNPYGERQKTGGNQGLIPILIDNILKDKEVEIWGDGEIIRDFIYVTDLVDGIYRIAFSETKNNVYNLGGGFGISINQILSKIIVLLKKTPIVINKERRVFDIQEIVLDISRAKKDFNWDPVVDIDIGITKTIQFLTGVAK